MKLYILRHAIADGRDLEQYPDDGLRPLTRAGSRKMEKIARALHKMKVCPDLILSSPLVRARQTAGIVRKEMKLKKDRLVLIDQLAPLADPNQLIAELQAKYMLDSLVLVGHEPDLSNLVSLLLSGSSSLAITMKKGGVCCLTVDGLAAGKCATLEWLLTPAQLVRLQ